VSPAGRIIVEARSRTTTSVRTMQSHVYARVPFYLGVYGCICTHMCAYRASVCCHAVCHYVYTEYIRDVYVGTYVRMMNSRETACRHCRRTCMHAHADAQTNSEQTWRLIIHSFYSQVVSIFFFFTEIFVEPCVPRVHGSNHRNKKSIGL
jgi:hypothetical protein